ncbi:MAG TPA: hypothetical protein VF690_06830 [Hymenobacter sp.]|jgi:hypothetical protein
MLTIYKYILQLTPTQQVTLPEGAQILSVQEQQGEVCLWALVNTEKPPHGVAIQMVGTGGQVNQSLLESQFLGTVQYAATGLVFHFFATSGLVFHHFNKAA